MSETQAPYEPRLPNEREAWTAANLVIEEHGSRAKEHARRRASELSEAEDEKGAQTWRLIIDRIGACRASLSARRTSRQAFAPFEGKPTRRFRRCGDLASGPNARAVLAM